MNIQIVDNAGNPIADSPQKPQAASAQVEGDVMGQIERRSVGQVLGIENDHDYGRYDAELGTLLAYAKSQTTDHSPQSLKWVIRSLEMKLGSPPFGEDRVKYVRNYAYLLLQEKKLREEKQKFERI